MPSSRRGGRAPWSHPPLGATLGVLAVALGLGGVSASCCPMWFMSDEEREDKKKAPHAVRQALSPEQWRQFHEEGYVILPKSQVFEDPAEFEALQRHIDDIMMGRAKVPYDKMMMQLDSATGRYEDSGAQTLGFKKPTLAYRKIQNLDLSPLVMAYLRKPLMRSACAMIYGAGTPISSFRTMFFNKPANQGTALPWHQDRWRHLDRDPILNVYLALDDATPENGCVQFIPRSHTRGIINPEHHSAFLTEAQTKAECDPSDPRTQILDLRLKAGEVVLMHNWVIHRSGVNGTSRPRRALSVSFMDARSRLDASSFSQYQGGELKTTGYPEGGTQFPVIFGGMGIAPAP